MNISDVLCVRCKGYRKLCSLTNCPILSQYKIQLAIISNIKGRIVEGSTPPSIIVGESGYPRVNVMVQVPPGIKGNRAKNYDDPYNWWGILNLEDIIRLRSSLLATITKANIHNPWILYDKEISLSAVSSKPVDTYIELRRVPEPILRFDSILTPVGPRAPMEKLKVVENPKISKEIEKIIWDDLRAYEAVWRLFNRNIDFYTIVRAFSLGLLGRIRRRRLIPTRWAITAVDSIISKNLLKRLREYKQINDYYVGFTEYLGNKFAIILHPQSYEFTWIEVWHPSSLWVKKSNKPIIIVNRERPGKGPKYVDGGYMAAKTGVLQYLNTIRRRAGVIIIREVLPSYYVPTGNWHIRISAYKALELNVMKVNDLNEALSTIARKLSVDVNELFRQIPSLNIKAQKRLNKYISS